MLDMKELILKIISIVVIIIVLLGFGDKKGNCMELTEKHYNAAGEIVDLIANKFGANRAIHPGTAISACARLSGSMLFRSFELKVDKVDQGNVVLSEDANEKGPILINILGWMIENTGNRIDKEKLDESKKEDSKIDFLKTLELTQEATIKIMRKYDFSYEDISYSCAMATAFIVTECKNELPIESGFNTAVYGFIEGTKTMPPRLASEKPKKKKRFNFGKK